MTVTGGWVLAPIVLALLVVGHGLLVERAAGVRLPGALLPGAGLAALIVLAGVLTILDATAQLAAPACGVAAAAGLALGLRRRRPWLGTETLVAAGVAVAAYAVFAAPSLLSGQASVAGYVKLDDSPTWLAMTAHVLQHGIEVEELAPSSYSRTIQEWLGGRYPVGGFLPLGVASRLAGVDPLASYQAIIAACAAILALGLFAAARELAGTAMRAGAAALVGVQASLFLGYTQWGGIKEAVTAALLPPLALAALLMRGQPRALAVLAVVSAALLGVLGPNGAAWIIPAAALAAAAVLWRGPMPRPSGRTLAAGALVLLVASLPAIVAIDFVRHTTSGAISSQSELGNLIEPLPLLQGAGLWPVGDFRMDPSPLWAAVALACACLLAAAAACAVAARRRRPEVPALVGVTLAGVIPAVVIGAPWIDAKALAMGAPALLTAAAVIAFRRTGEAPGPAIAAVSALAVALCAGTVWSTVSVAADVQIAPRERLDEALQLGRRLAGEGPTVVLDPDPYVSRYLLREADGEGASDLRFRPVARRDGGQFEHLTTAEVDEVAVADLWVYRAIVRRTSPVVSRPPEAFEPVHDGPLWESWRRPAAAAAPLARLPLGGPGDPTGVPRCDEVRALAATPGTRRLSAAPGRSPVLARIDPHGAPPAWRAGEEVRPTGDGTVAIPVTVPEAATWRLWVGGGVLGRLSVSVDGRPLGSRAHEFGHGAHWLRFGSLPLAAGRHVVELRYELDLRAGRGGPPWPIGPIALSPEGGDDTLEVPVARWRELCDGRRLDWIEALAT